MDLFEMLTGQLFKEDTLGQLANETQAEPSQIEKLTKLALPTMLEALKNNASSREGKESLEKALTKHEKDPSDLLGFLNDADTEDGEKILGHMFGNKKEDVVQNLAKNSGMDLGTVIKLLAKYAPMILSMLAMSKMTKKQQVPAPQQAPSQTGGNGLDLDDILGDLTGRAKTLPQQTNDGSGLMDVVKDILGGLLK